jgi:hypothetical protein
MAAIRPQTHRHPNRRPLRPFHAVHADPVGGALRLWLGEAKDFIAVGAIELGGRLSIVTNSGQLGEATSTA